MGINIEHSELKFTLILGPAQVDGIRRKQDGLVHIKDKLKRLTGYPAAPFFHKPDGKLFMGMPAYRVHGLSTLFQLNERKKFISYDDGVCNF